MQTSRERAERAVADVLVQSRATGDVAFAVDAVTSAIDDARREEIEGAAKEVEAYLQLCKLTLPELARRIRDRGARAAMDARREPR